MRAVTIAILDLAQIGQLTTDIALRKINIMALPLQLDLLRFYT